MICVAGVPRSGTSLVTQLLQRSGLELGPPEQLMPASINNTDGFWENLRFVQLNERLLAASGGTWFAPPSTLRPTPEITTDAKLLLADFAQSEPWGWKDPRNALTLPFWRTLLPSMKVLVCVRHPVETAASLVASTLMPHPLSFYWSVTRSDSPIRLRGGAQLTHQRLLGALRTAMSERTRRELVREVGLELWRIYNTSVLEAISTRDRLVTHYEAVCTRPRAELERILDFAGLQLPSDELDKVARAVTPSLRHQRAVAAPLDPDLASLYARLLHEAEYAP